MRRALFFILVLFSSVTMQAQTYLQNLPLTINYFITSGEFSGINEGIVIYRDECKIKAIGIRYNTSSYGLQLDVDTIVDFYLRNKDNYTVLKQEWTLSEDQCNYIIETINKIKSKPPEYNTYSNASEHYSVLYKECNYVYIDRTGKWDLFLEIKKVLDIDQKCKRL